MSLSDYPANNPYGLNGQGLLNPLGSRSAYEMGPSRWEFDQLRAEVAALQEQIRQLRASAEPEPGAPAIGWIWA